MGKSAVVARLLPITQLFLHSLISPPGADYNIDLHNPLRTLPPSFSPLATITAPITRIFPFGRGLLEDKLANIWCFTNVFGEVERNV